MKKVILIFILLIVSCDNELEQLEINGFYLGMTESEVQKLDDSKKLITINNIEGKIYLRYCDGNFSDKVQAILIKTHRPKDLLIEMKKSNLNNKENCFKLVTLSNSIDMLSTKDTFIGIWSSKMNYSDELSILICNE